MCVLLLTLAVPRLAASWKRLPGNAAVELFEAGALPIASGMTRAIVAQTDSLAIMPEPGPHLTIAYMSTALTEGVGLAETQRDGLLDVARYHLERAIAMAPVQARGWFMLAGLRYNDGGDLDAAAQALTLSFASDPHSPLLAPFRWPMVFALGSRLQREDRERGHLEFLSFFRTRPELAVRVALGENRLSELHALASDSPMDMQTFQTVLDRIRNPGS